MKIDPSEYPIIISKYLSGISTLLLGKEYQVNPTTICNILRKHQIVLRDNPKQDLTGQVYGRLTVVSEEAPHGKKKKISWKCQCSCGQVKITTSENLKDGSTQSCGCLNTETRIKNINGYWGGRVRDPRLASAKRVFRNYRDGDLTLEEFLVISQQDCYYCGAPPSNCQNDGASSKLASRHAKDNGYFIYNGLDRINNQLLHHRDNVVPCCKYCNYAKRERSYEEFCEWARRLSKKLKLHD